MNSHSHQPIKCLRHCRSFLFCVELPDFCPECNADLLTSSVAVPPFIAKSPIVNDRLCHGNILLIKPSGGKCFLCDFKNGDGLHCGVHIDNDRMYDYDEKGLHMNNQWTNSIRVIMPTTSPKDVTLVIRKVTTFIEEWTNSEYGYDPIRRNCFSFALALLQALGYYTSLTAEDFIETVILPHTKTAAKYISLHRQIHQSKEGVVIATNSEIG